MDLLRIFHKDPTLKDRFLRCLKPRCDSPPPKAPGITVNFMRAVSAIGAKVDQYLVLSLSDNTSIPLLTQQHSWIAHHLRRTIRLNFTTNLAERCYEEANHVALRQDLIDFGGEN